MIGFLTMTRYKHATIYVDQASRLSYVYLQKTATAEETLLGKEAFELHARERGVTILAYHADNGIFKAHKWVMACRGKGQSLTFAGVNAHHQNGIAERRIRILQELARTMLVHGNKRWPKAVTNNSWPYALRMANDVLIETPLMQNKEKLSPHQTQERNLVQNTGSHFAAQCMSWTAASKVAEASCTSGSNDRRWEHTSVDRPNMRGAWR
jgi:hypothetical protein